MQYSQFAFLALIAAAFYFLVMRPQQQQAKRQQQMIADLERGDSIVTIGGIYATVISVTGERLRVAVADGSELDIAPRAVSDVVGDGAEEDPEDEESDEEAVEGLDETLSAEDSAT